MQVPQHQLSVIQIELIKALLYFDIFKYPLTRDELFENSAINASRQLFNQELNNLLERRYIKEEEGFVSSLERNSSDIIRRLKGNEGASKILPTALKYSRKIAKFPFVDCVCISGSLSKNYFDENSDVDYFIITTPNRLWLCRTFLIVYYKLLSKSKKKFLCTNYFITSNNLSIPDINAFTGTELAFLIPTVNYQLYKKLTEKNNWYANRFPNKKESAGIHCIDTPNPFLKKMIESLLSGWPGDRLDDKLLHITLKRWRKKYPAMKDEDFDLQFRTRKDVCKRHSHGFQNKVMNLWQEKLNSFEQKFNFSLTP
ncbi:MAG: nucleotidyltransferase domain-containing protein [Bacteroidia bacterium]|nr:nucleotidyltransferase domain-containing protein [Bacteroidia bacterium]